MGKAPRFAVLFAWLLLVVSGVAGGQEIRKYVTPDGKIIYSDEPVPGAREVGTVAPPPEVTPEQRQAAEEAAQRNAERSNEVDRRVSQDQDSESDQRDTIREAEKALDEAKRKLAQGKDPLPGERKGTAGGASRLTEDYFKRQQANERAVQKAQQELNAARAAR